MRQTIQNKTEDEIRAWTTAYLAEALRIPKQLVKTNASFYRLGIDSVSAAAMICDLEAFIGRKIPPSVAFEYPSIDELARVLASEEKELVQAADSTDVVEETISPQTNMERLAVLNRRAEEWKRNGCFFYETEIASTNGAWVDAGGRRMLMMASYSYLGLLGHPHINAAAVEAIQQFGTGTHGVRVLAGTTSLHKELERSIAKFKHTEDAIAYSTGYMTNLATIATLMADGGVIIGDALNHASIVDGCLAANARFLTFIHNDMVDLEKKLLEAGSARKLVIVDAVYSMDGDIVKLPEVAKLCQHYGAMLMVDEAHSLGVLGNTGRGILEHFDMEAGAIDIQMGTLSKTIPSIGGYIAGKRELISALKCNARGFIFSAALPPAQAAAAMAALEVIQSEPERVAKLNRNLKRYVDGLRAAGLKIPFGDTPIIPILCNTEETTFQMTRECQNEGLFVLPIVFPAVPVNLPRLRTTVTAAHSDSDIDFAVKVLVSASKRLEFRTQ